MTRYLNFILNSVCNEEIAECNYSRNLIENIFFILFSLVFGMIKKTIIEKFIRICMYITEINLHYKPEFALQHYLPSEFTKISSRCSLINSARLRHCHSHYLYSQIHIAFNSFLIPQRHFVKRKEKSRLWTLSDRCNLCQLSLSYRSFFLFCLWNIKTHLVLAVHKNSSLKNFCHTHLFLLPEAFTTSFPCANH